MMLQTLLLSWQQPRGAGGAVEAQLQLPRTRLPRARC